MWKKRLNYILSSVIMFAFVQGSHARLFETVEECDARYGEPVACGDFTNKFISSHRSYIKNEVAIYVGFRSNIANWICYTPVGEIGSKKFSEAEAQELQQIYSPLVNWKAAFSEIDDTGIQYYYTRQNDDIYCLYNCQHFFKEPRNELTMISAKFGAIYTVEFFSYDYFGVTITKISEKSVARVSGL